MSSLKYRNNRQSLAWFSAAIAQQVTSEVDLVTWIPTTARRRRKRGFDHAELLGRRVGRRLAIPAKPLLRAPVARSARSQTGLTARERERRDAFVAVRCRAGSVLVVDDVITTGATLKSAAAALRCVGVDRVHGAAIAYTKPRGSELRHA